jgi:hypothetical protein
MIRIDERELPWPEVQLPTYPEGKIGDWRIDTVQVPLLRGYWRGLRLIKGNNVVRLTKGESGAAIWMSSTPMEMESQQHALAEMSGNVVIVGGGLGITIFNAIQKQDVNSVIVIEKDADIINFLLQVIFEAGWPYKEKIHFIRDDALAPKDVSTHLGHIDFLWVDIWETLGCEKALEEVQNIQSYIEADRVGWWGMEIDFISFLGKEEKSPPATDEDWERFEQFSKLPLMKAEGQVKMAADAARNVFLA